VDEESKSAKDLVSEIAAAAMDGAAALRSTVERVVNLHLAHVLSS